MQIHSEFLQNRYTKHYYNIINYAKSRYAYVGDTKRNRANVEASLGYMEKHHIVPRCMGGSDEHSNMVWLTVREHLHVHLVLTRMVKSQYRGKMFYAIKAMVAMCRSGGNNGTKDSRKTSLVIPKSLIPIVEKAKIEAASESSRIQKGRKVWTEDQKKQMSIARTGTKRSPETCKNISRALKGKPRTLKNFTPEEYSERKRQESLSKTLNEKNTKGSPSHCAASTYMVFPPDGSESYEISNLREFCRQNGLSDNCMSSVVRKYPNSKHKGWKAYRVSFNPRAKNN